MREDEETTRGVCGERNEETRKACGRALVLEIAGIVNVELSEWWLQRGARVSGVEVRHKRVEAAAVEPTHHFKNRQ